MGAQNISFEIDCKAIVDSFVYNNALGLTIFSDFFTFFFFYLNNFLVNFVRDNKSLTR